MKTLTKLFSKKAWGKNQVCETVEHGNINTVSKVGNIPPVDLFIDNQPPQLESNNKEQVPNRISQFLKRDYLSIGFNDGYEYHSNDTLEAGKKKIIAEFLLVMDQSIEEKQLEILKYKNLLVDVSNVSEETSKKLQNSIETLILSLNSIQKQKELSVDNEGWVMTAIHSYYLGFKQGTDGFIAGEDLINSIKTFNL
jgi:uncharacterized protein YsxB (DUF464 family)